MPAFFSPDLFAFLDDLARNNDRDWFKSNQARYEASVREPARAFVRAMGEQLATAAPQLVASDKKVGGSLMRPQRDTRFSNDKTPYKTNVGIQFRHAAGKDVHAPGLYVHFDTDSCFVGLGMYAPDNPTLGRVRDRIVAVPDTWSRITGDSSLTERWRFGAEERDLKRVPRGFDAEHPHARDLRRKSFILVHDTDRDQVLAPDFTDFLVDLTRRGEPLMRFVCEAVGQPY